MKKSTKFKSPFLILMAISLFQFSCKTEKKQEESKEDENAIDFITETSGKVDFGKTDISA